MDSLKSELVPMLGAFAEFVVRSGQEVELEYRSRVATQPEKSGRKPFIQALNKLALADTLNQQTVSKVSLATYQDLSCAPGDVVIEGSWSRDLLNGDVGWVRVKIPVDLINAYAQTGATLHCVGEVPEPAGYGH